jgi:hypothetical protein
MAARIDRLGSRAAGVCLAVGETREAGRRRLLRDEKQHVEFVIITSKPEMVVGRADYDPSAAHILSRTPVASASGQEVASAAG